MRASIGVAFTILSYTYLREKKYIPFILLSGVAWGFHSSSIVGMISLIIVHLLIRKPGKPYLIFFIIALVIPFSFGFLVDVAEWLVSIGGLPPKYLTYIDIFIYGDYRSYWVQTSMLSKGLIFDITSRFIFVVMATLPVLSRRRRAMEVDTASLFLAYVVFIGFVIYVSVFFLFKTEYGGRLSLPLDIFLILALPYCGKKTQLSKRNSTKILRWRAIAIAFAVGYWVVWIMIGGWSGSNEYNIRF